MTVNTNCGAAVPPVHGVVEFVPADFKALYPQFVSVADGTLTLYFQLATLILRNSCGSVVQDATQRERLLNLLVAHIAALQPVAPAGGPGSGGALVGRIASATEGSVSVTAEYAAEVSASMAWFIQTQYGALFWQLTATYRSFRYVAPCYPGGDAAGSFAGRRGY
jgi:hypothetical protein